MGLVPPADSPLRPATPPDVSRGPNPLWALLGAPLRLLDGLYYHGARWYEDQCENIAQGLAAASQCRSKHLSVQFGSLGSKSGFWGGGFGLHNDLIEPAGFKFGATAAATWRLYQEYTAYAGWNDPGKLPFVRLTGFYDRDTRNQFFGLGPVLADDEEEETDYSLERWGADFKVGIPERKWLWGALGARYEKAFVFEGENDDELDTVDAVFFEDIPGVRSPQMEIWGPEGEITLDLTDSPGYPTAGVKLKGRGGVYRSLNDLDFDWSIYGGEVQAHVPLGSDWYVISALAGMDHAEPEGGSEIPFIYLPTLGGSERLRSFETWRFTDHTAAYGTAEFRYRIWQESTPDRDRAGAIETVFFVDTGDVGPELEDIDFFEFNSYGVEFRMYVQDRALFRAGVANGEEGARFNFKFSDIY